MYPKLIIMDHWIVLGNYIKRVASPAYIEVQQLQWVEVKYLE